jgi:hypothetical protein
MRLIGHKVKGEVRPPQRPSSRKAAADVGKFKP